MFHRNEFLLPSSKTAMPAAHQQGRLLIWFTPWKYYAGTEEEVRPVSVQIRAGFISVWPGRLASCCRDHEMPAPGGIRGVSRRSSLIARGQGGPWNTPVERRVAPEGTASLIY
ncbi:hypothetical protein GQ55_9G172200 [Panicum hallii var. hallii]|uniref:Uncharacterized protein n=1 Tax=Panicum hallii var. hallii TaxID=1504633 RepID=A0A2T7C474_9POAL|nr:hypothetical protein GQ55_9G172200 [Panicum hallii var. hallii]